MATSRRSSTCTCRSRSSRSAASCSAALLAIGYLRTGDRIWDMRSYCAIHMSLIFSVGGAVTGSIWAKGIVGPLVGVAGADARLLPDRDPAVRDLSAAALLDRGSRAPGALRERVRDRRRRVRAAQLHRVRLSTEYVHPRVLNLEGGNLPGSMRLAFYMSLIGHRAAVRDADEVRDGRQVGAHRGAAPAADARWARMTSRSLRRSAAPS